MKVVVTADFHGHLPPDGEVLQCDLLILAGDVLPRKASDLDEFEDWLRRQPATAIVGVAGNEDFLAEDEPDAIKEMPWTYLRDEAVELDVAGEKVKVFGSPRSARFNNSSVLTGADDDLTAVWEKIPDDTEILITHGPAYGLLDTVKTGQSVGSMSLRRRLEQGLDDLRLHAFGHIHECYGITAFPRTSSVLEQGEVSSIRWTAAVNGAYVDHRYRPGNQPIPISLTAGYVSTFQSEMPA